MSEYRTSPLPAQAPGHAETITKWDGHTYGGRVPAYMGLAQKTGGVFWENPPTVAEGLRQVGLDYEVTLEPLQTLVACTNDEGMPDIQGRMLDKHFATVARFPDGRLIPYGPVGSKYRPIQNTTVAELGQHVVDGGDGEFRAICAFGEPFGSSVYMAFDLGNFLVGGSDNHNLTLGLLTSHDGTSGLTALAAPVRVRCTNQCSGIFGNRMAGRYTIRHTESADGRVQEIRDALGLTWKYVERYQDESETLLGRNMTERDFLAWEHQMFQVPDFEDATPRQRTIVANRDQALLDIWNGDTSEFGRNTAFAAAQSVYEFLDWNASVKGDDASASRMERILAGATETAKARVWGSLISA